MIQRRVAAYGRRPCRKQCASGVLISAYSRTSAARIRVGSKRPADVRLPKPTGRPNEIFNICEEGTENCGYGRRARNDVALVRKEKQALGPYAAGGSPLLDGQCLMLDYPPQCEHGRTGPELDRPGS